tara:strand:- start:299 stop:514 length:216 start_codon:yes stop_codon:yes gene_type:complete
MDKLAESEYFKHLYKEGLSLSVIKYFEEMAEVNNRSITYFMIMALEELKLFLDQKPDYAVDLEDGEMETQH